MNRIITVENITSNSQQQQSAVSTVSQQQEAPGFGTLVTLVTLVTAIRPVTIGRKKFGKFGEYFFGVPLAKCLFRISRNYFGPNTTNFRKIRLPKIRAIIYGKII